MEDDEDDDEPRDIGFLDVVKILGFVLGIFSLASLFVSGTFFWGVNLHDEFGVQMRRILPVSILNYEKHAAKTNSFQQSRDRLLSEALLAEHDGTQGLTPIFLGVRGTAVGVFHIGRF